MLIAINRYQHIYIYIYIHTHTHVKQLLNCTYTLLIAINRINSIVSYHNRMSTGTWRGRSPPGAILSNAPKGNGIGATGS